MTDRRRPLAVTMGDPAGIGPEIACKAFVDPALAGVEVVLVASRAVIVEHAAKMGLSVPRRIIDIGAPAVPVTLGSVQQEAGRLSALCIEAAISGSRDGSFAGVVTAPISKSAIHLAGVPFPGHTEWLAARCGVQGEAMLMYDPALAVALATCHQPLMSVAATLTTARIIEVGRLLAAALGRLRSGPVRLAVCGLNPHAGEDGLLGHEDAALVAPAVAELRRLGIPCDGPLPADTAFTPANRARYTGYIALYHDQGLIPFKALYVDTGVNVSLGLPIVRTSVDHGTAFNIAGQGIADHRSLVEAILLAARLAGNP